MDTKAYWDRVYATKAPDEVSWFQAHPGLSLQLIDAAGVDVDMRIIDVGAGASRLIDALVERGFTHVGALDVAEAALTQVKTRLGSAAHSIEWFAADVTKFKSPHLWDIWHDRAVFHFLIDSNSRKAYIQTLESSISPDGHAIIATFGPDGPTRCSGLDVQRYSPTSLAKELGSGWTEVTHHLEDHRTPSGTVQQFQFSLFRRTSSP
jgi:2-polyprenyl-3-methyl-5-hydroxy-6-metoxy-1,4-benzoquinol methylase